MELALFPLSQMILPGGRMALRVFEPRYQRLVKEANQRPFASALLNPYVQAGHPERIFPLVTEVRIIDFSQLPDGLLGITIEGVQRCQINKRWQEPDQLHVAECTALPAWPEQTTTQTDSLLHSELAAVFDANPALSELYSQPQWLSVPWLVQRWLEILTMPAQLKADLMAAPDAGAGRDLLLQWLTEQTPADVPSRLS